MQEDGLVKEDLLEEKAWSWQHLFSWICLSLVQSLSLLILLEKSRPILSSDPFLKHQSLWKLDVGLEVRVSCS